MSVSSNSRLARSNSLPVGPKVETCNGLASAFLFNIKDGQKAYRYDVEVKILCDCPKRPELDLTRALWGEGKRAQFKQLCSSLFSAAKKQTNSFGLGVRSRAMVYDNRSVLFTAFQIGQQTIKVDKLNFDKVVCDNVDVTKTLFALITITPNSRKHVLQLSDFTEDNAEPLCSFLNLLTSQQAVDQKMYFCSKGGLFENRILRTVNHVQLRSGVYKGVEMVKNDGSPCPAIKLDFSVSPFFKSQTVLETSKDILCGRLPDSADDYQLLLKLLMNVEIQTLHRQKVFHLGRFSERPIGNTKLDGGSKTVVDYFKEVYHQSVNGHLRGASPRIYDETYPMELCRIMPEQSVRREQMSQELSDALREVNVVRPGVRLKHILYHLKQLAFFGDGETTSTMKEFGVTIDISSNNINLYKMQAPVITYGLRAKQEVVKGKWTAHNAEFIETSENRKWALFYQKFDAKGHSQAKLIEQFVKKLREMARAKSMFLQTEPAVVVPVGNVEKFDWVSHLEKLDTVDFLLFIDSKTNVWSHDVLKYYESRFKILTQHVKLETIDGAMNRPDQARYRGVLDNVLMKANVKFFGLNFSPQMECLPSEFSLESEKVLVIGIDLAFPPPTFMLNGTVVLSPSVVGITANIALFSPAQICGDYFYQPERKDQVNSKILVQKAQWILEALKGSGRKKPLYVFVMRDGLSQGQYEGFAKEELNAIRDGFLLADKEFCPKYALMIGTKRHLERTFKTNAKTSAGDSIDPSSVSNPDAGMVTNNKFRSAKHKEQLMQPQNAIQGAAKPLKLTLLVNECEDVFKLKHMDDFVNALCHTHQICTSTTALPEPIYQAHELAKRGLNNFNTMTRQYPSEIPLMDLPPHLETKSNRKRKMVNCDQLTAKFSYAGSWLEGTRFTA